MELNSSRKNVVYLRQLLSQLIQKDEPFKIWQSPQPFSSCLPHRSNSGLVKILEAKKNGRWENAYTNKTKEAIPEDLKEALMKEKKAWENFQRFANSYRNMYVGWVNNAKTDKTRMKRIKKIVEQSLLNKKLIFL